MMRHRMIALLTMSGLLAAGLSTATAADEPAGAAQQSSVVVDNTEAALTPADAWSRSSSLPAYYGANYSHARPGPAEPVARWQPQLPGAGDYAIAVWLPHGNDQRSPAVTYRVHHAGQVTTFEVDQQQAGGYWQRGPNSLPFDGSGDEYVELVVNDAVASGSSQTYVIADAVRFSDPADPPQPPGVPTGLTVTQEYGFATVAWDPVETANEYQIERTPMDGDQPDGPGAVVGRWLPDRHVGADGEPAGVTTFADSGFALGERYRWRVRAVTDGVAGEWSAPVDGETEAVTAPPELQTGFERSNAASWTSHAEEMGVLESIAAGSDRVRLETIGETYEGRPIHLAVVGDGGADKPSILISCTVHGAERSGREACLILLRELAYSDDPWVTAVLDRTTVLINPTANPDGQAVGRRTNAADQDLNRDNLPLRHPESFALAEVIRDHRPDLVVDAHEAPAGADTAPMWPRSLNVDEPLWRLSQDDLTLGWHFTAGHAAGWSLLPYDGWGYDNWENWLHNVAGLKNAMGQLLETPSGSSVTRPEAPTNSPPNLRRRVYTQLWSFHTLLDYHHENLEAIRAAITAAETRQEANDGPVYLDGAYEPPFHPPRNERNTVSLDPPPCGYRLTDEQLALRENGTLIGERAGEEWTSHTVGERLAAHGVEVEEIGGGFAQVLLGQRMRAVIPFLLDPDLDTAVRPVGTPNLGMVDAVRLDDRRATVVVGGADTGVPNQIDEVGCSINDLIADEQVWPSQGAFVRHVDDVLSGLVDDGTIDDRQAGGITRAAATSGVGR
ncbi:M14 family zinc carboxypeptidase [Jiangella muralis]|uniref:golvesin C-terminal-like domain-containing protein n=1 Tax=Jiangella muralis TaxID=702383 RepID=UPI0009FAFA93|nr:M14 family zinc carboxypeptidase [Jiangella muralis]